MVSQKRRPVSVVGVSESVASCASDHSTLRSIERNCLEQSGYRQWSSDEKFDRSHLFFRSVERITRNANVTHHWSWSKCNSVMS